MYKLEIKRFFDAAHQLTDSPELVTKACARLHGHTYLVKVEIEGDKNPKSGMVADFKGIKDIIDIFDHRFINDVFAERDHFQQTTAENISWFIYNEICRKYGSFGIGKIKVSVCEGYKGLENASWSIFPSNDN